MRVIRIGERYSISTDEVEAYDFGAYEWITMQTKQGVSAVDVKFEKHHLHYDMEKWWQNGKSMV